MKILVKRNTKASGEDLEAGETVNVSDRDGRLLVAMGKAAEVEGAEDEKSVEDAIEELTPGDPEHFTQNGEGVPQCDALSEILGREVSAAERNEAWKNFTLEDDE